MAPKKKPPSGLSGIMDVVRKNAASANAKGAAATLQSAADIMRNWKWVDFIDPHTGHPNLLLEYLFGARGYLCGRMYLVEGDEAASKSSLCFLSFAMGQKTCDATCWHGEAEHAPPPPDYIASFGTDTSKLMISQPGALGRALLALQMIVNAAKTEVEDRKLQPILASLDSVSGFSADEDQDGENLVEGGNIGGLGYHARKISEFFRERGWWMEKNDLVLICTAQHKDKINTATFGNKAKNDDPTTIAAKPLRFHATGRLTVEARELWEPVSEGSDKKRVTGKLITFYTAKNKISPPHRRITVPLRSDLGFDFVVPCAQFLKERSPWIDPKGAVFLNLETRGSWYVCEELNVKGQGESTLRLFMDELAKRTDIVMQLRESLRIRGFGLPFEEQYAHVPENPTVADLAEAGEAEA
jgi:RecA/RadA recombinase